MSDPTPIAFNQEGEGWHLDPPRNKVLRLGLGFLGVLGLVAGIGNLVSGDTGTGVVVLVFAAVFLGGCVGLSRRRVPLRPRHLAVEPGPGLLLPTRGGSGFAIVGFSVLGLLCVLGGLAGGVVTAVVGALFGLFFLAGAWGTLKQRRTSDRGILLTPYAVVLRTRVDPETIPWDDLVRVRDHWGRAVRVGPTLPDDVVRNWLTFETRDPDGDRLSLLSGSPSPSVPVEVLGTEPTLTLAACRHYLEHPGDRAELASPTSVRRWV